MRSLFYVLTALAVMGLAFWAYRENYRTQARLTEIDRLQSEIGHLRESMNVLKAEWAYLNRPDRLRELAEINFDRLGLLPLRAAQFGTAAQVGYPEKPLPPVTDPVETFGALPETEETTP
ncbi:cell division protein FtsL [Frigidibacter sp.]|uniref:cell division protein FtsL n=1 Tax=Frigidibacter sp. TaxID=2586418 RepID=UPI0027351F88|nr:cell division protein FtsL [Frigidibacter sp.]MDP3340886.1 cell division protein FtsL [Frigidibacter sp.]